MNSESIFDASNWNLWRGKAVLLPSGGQESHPVSGARRCHGCTWRVRRSPPGFPLRTSVASGVCWYWASVKKPLEEGILLCPMPPLWGCMLSSHFWGFLAESRGLAVRWKHFHKFVLLKVRSSYSWLDLSVQRLPKAKQGYSFCQS